MNRLGDNLINISISSVRYYNYKEDRMRKAFESSVVKCCMQEKNEEWRKGFIKYEAFIRFSILQNHFCTNVVMRLYLLFCINYIRIFEVDLFLS